MKSCDETLLLQLATDLDTSFPQLVLHYQHQLYTFAFRLTRNTHDAEEITQEAFILAYYALDGYSPEKIRAIHLRPWLYAITRNFFYNTRRKQVVQTLPLDISEESALLEIADEDGDLPEQEAEKEEVRRTFSQLVGTLPPRYREAITLYYFEDFSYSEIAELLHQPLGTVKSNVHRGIRLLRQMSGTISIE